MSLTTDYSSFLTPFVIDLLENNTPEEVVNQLDELVTTSVTVGDHIQFSRVIEKRSQDSE